MEHEFLFKTYEDGTVNKIEVITKFRVDDIDRDCLIYKLVGDDKHFYIALYDRDTNYKNLDINFSDKEKLVLKEAFEKLVFSK